MENKAEFLFIALARIHTRNDTETLVQRRALSNVSVHHHYTEMTLYLTLLCYATYFHFLYAPFYPTTFTNIAIPDMYTSMWVARVSRYVVHCLS